MKTRTLQTAAEKLSDLTSLLDTIGANYIRKNKTTLSITSYNNKSYLAYYDSKSSAYCLLDEASGNEIFSSKNIAKFGTFIETTLVRQQTKPAKEITTTKKPNIAKMKPENRDEKINAEALIKLASEPVELVELKHDKIPIEGYRGVLNTKRGKVVSVVSDSYRLLPNKVVLDPVLNYLEKKNINYTLDRFSYVTEQRMQIHFTFPDIKIKDDTKEGILGGMFLHNSYNSTESYRMLAGGIRQVCSNGLILGNVLSKIRIIHQAKNIQEIAVANLEAVFDGFYNNTDKIEQTIKNMITEKATVKLLIEASKKVELRIIAHVMRELGLLEEEEHNAKVPAILADLNPKQVLKQNVYQVYNLFTRFISHQTLQRYRLEYLNAVSKFFGL